MTENRDGQLELAKGTAAAIGQASSLFFSGLVCDMPIGARDAAEKDDKALVSPAQA